MPVFLVKVVYFPTISLYKDNDCFEQYVQYILAMHKHSLINIIVSQIVEHTEIDEHLEEIAKTLMVEQLFYTISIATNNRTPGIFPLR